jgi:hypothetical protein
LAAERAAWAAEAAAWAAAANNTFDLLGIIKSVVGE